MKFSCELNLIIHKFCFVLNEILFKIVLLFLFFFFCMANIEFKRIKEEKKRIFFPKISKFHLKKKYT